MSNKKMASGSYRSDRGKEEGANRVWAGGRDEAEETRLGLMKTEDEGAAVKFSFSFPSLLSFFLFLFLSLFENLFVWLVVVIDDRQS